MLRQEFQKLIQLLSEKIKTYYGDNLISVVLFGSQARGTPRPDSDIDLLIVLSRAPKGRLKRTEDFTELEETLEPYLQDLRRKGIYTYINPVIKTKEEILKGSPLLLDIVEDGKILYDKENFMKEVLTTLRDKLQKLGAKRVWHGSSWYWILKPDLKPGEVIEL